MFTLSHAHYHGYVLSHQQRAAAYSRPSSTLIVIAAAGLFNKNSLSAFKSYAFIVLCEATLRRIYCLLILLNSSSQKPMQLHHCQHYHISHVAITGLAHCAWCVDVWALYLVLWKHRVVNSRDTYFLVLAFWSVAKALLSCKYVVDNSHNLNIRNLLGGFNAWEVNFVGFCTFPGIRCSTISSKHMIFSLYSH